MRVELSITDLTVGKALQEAYSVAKREGWLEKFLAIFRKKHRVLVVGSSGVGKTQLIRSLTDLVPEIVSVLERTAFAEKNRLRISDQLFEFLDAPGELNKIQIRQDAIGTRPGKKFALVLNVASYGYHEYSESGDQMFFQDDGTVDDQALADHREFEAELVVEWVGKLQERGLTTKVITIVTKADIWWDSREEVIDHYRCGKYSEPFAELGIDHTVLAYCSRIQRFHGQSTISSSFDETDKLQLRDMLFRAFLAGVGRPNGSFD